MKRRDFLKKMGIFLGASSVGTIASRYRDDETPWDWPRT